MLWKIKQALPCEEEMASYSEMPKRERKAKKPYVWYFCVYDYVSYVFIEAAFEFSSTPSLQCTINVKYRVVPEKVTGMKPVEKQYFRLLVCGRRVHVPNWQKITISLKRRVKEVLNILPVRYMYRSAGTCTELAENHYFF
jgi:hypothetical protein